MRLKVAGSLTELLFANQAVIPVLLKALGDDRQRPVVVEVLSHHLDQTSDQADFSRVRGNLPGFMATLNTATPAIVQTLSLKNEEISPLVYGLLGRIISFSSLSRDADLRKAIEPRLEVYLKGLDETAPAIREEVLDRLEAGPDPARGHCVGASEVSRKSDLPPEHRETCAARFRGANPHPRARGPGKHQAEKKGFAEG